MSGTAADVEPKRVPCATCKRPIIEGARKCRHCKAWQPEGPRAPRAAIMVASAVLSVFLVIVTSQKSTVGDAPPLTALPGDSAQAGEPSPAAVGPDPTTPAPKALPPADARKWGAREIRMGDVHPLDLAFSKDGSSLFVSADDATVREYKVESGEIVHKASVPAKGDHVRLLFGHYLAILHDDPRMTRIPVLDLSKWDRDPTILEVGRGPRDIAEMSDGTVVTAASGAHRVSRFALPSGKQVADITLAQSNGQVFLVRAEGRPYLAALGAMSHAGRPAGAWLDLFDPAEQPFGATRRSIAVGSDPRLGDVTSSGAQIFFPDFASNSATLLDVGDETTAHTVEVGQGPIAGYVFAGDRWGATLDATARTITAVRLDTTVPRMQISTLMLDGEPRDGVMFPDRTTLFVALGGNEDPPRGQGVAIIAGDPPAVVATLPTGAGAISVAVSHDGARAAVANYFAKSITVLE
jgi:hypothetical protein